MRRPPSATARKGATVGTRTRRAAAPRGREGRGGRPAARQAPAQTSSEPSPLVQRVLDLQRDAGNAAVSDLIASGHVPTVQRQGDGGATTAVVARPTIRSGSRGPAVKELQVRLNALGGALTEDGIFGKRTRVQVMAFQNDHDLEPDGVVGPLTWAALDVGGPAAVPTEQRRARDFDEDLSDEERNDWALLGGTKEDWEGGRSPAVQQTVEFRDLTDAQRGAAVRLGYTESSWNEARESTAETAAALYLEEEERAGEKSETLPDEWIGSLRARAILAAEFGDVADITLPKVKFLTAAQTKQTYEGFYGAGKYPAGGLEGFFHEGTMYLNLDMQSLDTVVHEMLHAQEKPEWDAFAYVGRTSIGEGATELLTHLAVTTFGKSPSSSYPSEKRLVEDMNAVSSLTQMKQAYFLGGGHVATYKQEVEKKITDNGHTYAGFKARIDADDIPGARAMLV
jgi:peptidoglycan hydrolase-like protein with peptidoglycan-binding domain